MTRLASSSHTLALFTACFLLVLSISPLAAQDNPEETPEPIAITFGAGRFNLLTPAVGLADLDSYQATLGLSFDGVRDGQQDLWSRTFTMVTSQNPVARQMTIETAGSPSVRLFMLETAGVVYERRGENACTASHVQPGNTLAEVWEPASFLSGVIGADEAGADTVNGIASNQYTFDEQALGARDFADSSGQLWVAADGDTLIRYLLETTGGAELFGAGVEGTLFWDYELTESNQPLSLAVPPDCPFGLIDLPLLPDAANVLSLPGMTTYTSLTPLADAAAFYAELLSAAGGEASFPPSISDTTALLETVQGDQVTSVIITAEDGVTSVFVALNSTTPIAALNAGEAPATVAVQAEDGGTVDIPLLPDATDVTSTQGILSYFSATEQADIAAFYQERLLALGGQVYTPFSIFGETAVGEIALGDYLLAINIRAETDGSSIFIRVDPPGTFSPIAAPAPTLAPPVPNEPPADCVEGSAAIPILPDAASVVQAQGVTSYTTQTSVTNAAAFYMEQVAANGGQISAMMPVSDAMAMLAFTQSGQTGTVMIMPAGGVNSVMIALAAGGFGLPAAPCSTPGAAVQPPGDALNALAPACAIISASGANQRSGPGTTYVLAGTLAGGVSAPVLGQATGADGFIWWQLGENLWVRSDVVTTTGDCERVPIVQP